MHIGSTQNISCGKNVWNGSHEVRVHARTQRGRVFFNGSAVDQGRVGPEPPGHHDRVAVDLERFSRASGEQLNPFDPSASDDSMGSCIFDDGKADQTAHEASKARVRVKFRVPFDEPGDRGPGGLQGEYAGQRHVFTAQNNGAISRFQPANVDQLLKSACRENS
jgi:hypothetical protein